MEILSGSRALLFGSLLIILNIDWGLSMSGWFEVGVVKRSCDFVADEVGVQRSGSLALRLYRGLYSELCLFTGPLVEVWWGFCGRLACTWPRVCG